MPSLTLLGQSLLSGLFIGVLYGLLGVGFMLLAHVRMRVVEAAVDRGEFARLDARWKLR